MNTTTILLTLAISIVASSANAILLEKSVISGKIKKFDNKTVTLETAKGKTITIARADLPKDMSLSKSDKLSVPISVSPQNLQVMNLPYQLEMKTLNDKQLRQLVKSYQVFVYSLDKQMMLRGGPKNDGGTKSKKVSEYFQFLMDVAFAQDAPNYTCFYAGWPTTASGTHCRGPWNQTVRTALDGDSMQYSACGAEGVYRCNPVIFGPSTATREASGIGPRQRVNGTIFNVRAVPTAEAGKGICIEASGESQIVERCLAASRGNLANIVANIKSNPAAFERFARSTADFCRTPRNSTNAACGNLRERLASIEFGRQDSVRAIVLDGGSCTNVVKANFGQSAGSGESCPGSLCTIQANCNNVSSGEGAATTAPTPVTAVCGCSLLGSDPVPNAGQVVACINDQSIAVLNRTTPPEPDAISGGGPEAAPR